METEQSNEPCITIIFDNGDHVQVNKSYLIKHSSYFEAMFSGKFIESQSGDQIQLKDINNRGFMSVIECLKYGRIKFECMEELLLVLETSQLLQFTDISQKSIQLIKEKYLFTAHAISIFSVSFRLGLQELYEKARIYILYNFKTFLVQNRDSFFELTEEDLQLLLNDNGLNIDSEIDVYDLIIDWCSETHKYDIEYEMAINCVHFNTMTKNQLQSCILKTNNLSLQNTIKQYMNYTNESEELTGLLIRPIRSVPYVLCAMKNEEDGHAFIYRWDWASLKFTKFLKLDPLPLDTFGYHVVIKEMDIYVLAGEIGYGRGMWNEEGWKYNLLTQQWTMLEGFIPSKRRHGVGYFCNDELFLIGGLTKHRLPNELVEKFKIDKDKNTLLRVESYLCHDFGKNVDRVIYSCLEYKGQLIMITKGHNPMWFELRPGKFNSTSYKWDGRLMNIKAIIICAVTYLDNVYVLTYNDQYTIVLYSYNPVDQSSQEIKCFKTAYVEGITMCAFNINKAMVFYNNTLEYYSIDNNIYKECATQIDNSFFASYFFSIPIY